MCNQSGHKSNECPTRYAIHIIEEGDSEPSRFDSSEEGEVEEFLEGDEGELVDLSYNDFSSLQSRRKKSAAGRKL